jgi:hypothetical protein
VRSDAALLAVARTDPSAFRELYDRFLVGTTPTCEEGVEPTVDAGKHVNGGTPRRPAWGDLNARRSNLARPAGGMEAA